MWCFGEVCNILGCKIRFEISGIFVAFPFSLFPRDPKRAMPFGGKVPGKQETYFADGFIYFWFLWLMLLKR